LRVLANNLFDVLFAFQPGHDDLMAAFGAADFEIHAGAQHKERAAPARVLFLHLQNVAGPNVHGAVSSLCGNRISAGFLL
jgi:hypothetical protein